MSISLSKERIKHIIDCFEATPVKVKLRGCGKKYILHSLALEKCSNLIPELEKSRLERPGSIPKLEIETEDHEAFEIFLQFSYFGAYILVEDDIVDRLSNVYIYSRLYIMAEMLGAEELGEHALKKLAAFGNLGNRAWSPSEWDRPPSQTLPDEALANLVKTIPLVYGSLQKTESPTRSVQIEDPTFKQHLIHIYSASMEQLRKRDDFVAMVKTYPELAADILIQVPKVKLLKRSDTRKGFLLQSYQE
ncbi:hypothetical protein ABW21_db0209403 [Orbilia brochopaga]|nr:hypothetical protein ABW21_db0209403 [Drechslerella brochopaga]